MNKYNIIAYIINALILFLLSFASAIFSRKYNFPSLITEAFKPRTDLEVSDEINKESSYMANLNLENFTQEEELEISDPKIEKESLPESVFVKETPLHQENTVIDGENYMANLNLENFTQEKELGISDPKIEKESLPESVFVKETPLHQENTVIDGENKIPSIKELINTRDFWSEVIRLFIVILIGFTIIRYVQW